MDTVGDGNGGTVSGADLRTNHTVRCMITALLTLFSFCSVSEEKYQWREIEVKGDIPSPREGPTLRYCCNS